MRTGLLCFGAAAVWTMADVTPLMLMDFAAASGAATQIVDRRSKDDRGDAPRVAATPAAERVASIEVVGLARTAIVFKDSAGRVLFATDPVTNTTVVSRGIALPAMTVRTGADAVPQPLAVSPDDDAPEDRPAAEQTPKRETLPDGCEPAASPLAPAAAHPLHARCVSAAPTATQMAALR